MNKGFLPALLSFLAWGGAPLYFNLLESVSPVMIVAHRIIWSVLVCALFLTVGREWREIERILRSPSLMRRLGLSTLLISTNWFLFIWAVNSGRILDASFGYYINPLISMALGAIFLKERLALLQRIAIAGACCGVILMGVGRGAPPWIALSLALTFGFYGLIRKTAVVPPLAGLAFETMLATGPAMVYLLIRGEFWPEGGHAPIHWLLAGTGFVTALPLLWFNMGARHLPLTAIGFMQFIGPTCMFLVATLGRHETTNATVLAAFVVIWSSVAVFLAAILSRRLRRY